MSTSTAAPASTDRTSRDEDSSSQGPALRARLLRAATLLGLAHGPAQVRAAATEARTSSAAAPVLRPWQQWRERKAAAAAVGTHRVSPLGWVGRLCALAGGTTAGVLAIGMVVQSLQPHVTAGLTNTVSVQLDVPDTASLPGLGERSVVYDAAGDVLAVLHDEIDRRLVPLSEVPPHVRDAVIAAEDRKFWEHPGYDVEGIARAAMANAEAGTITQGGSTITQQLAKTAVGNEESYERKINELLYAVALEETFNKEELLERYLNQVYFGAGAYGIAAAAEEFFHKDQSQLTINEAALLAGLIRSPGSTDPRVNADVATRRRDQVLAAMAEMGTFDAAQLGEFQALPIAVQPHVEGLPREPHFVDAVIQEFVRNPDFGATEQDRFNRLYSGGLRIYTTLDPRMQSIAGEVLAEEFDDPLGPTGAIAAVNPTNGRILAIEGGVSYENDAFNLAVQARRQPGSAFKPFVYAAAIQDGFPTGLQLDGANRAYFEGICGWAREDIAGCTADPEDRGVRNFGGSSFGRLSMREALVSSVNTAAAQLMVILGPDRVVQLAGEMGVDVDAATGGFYNHAVALGGLQQGITPLEMASAYGTFANNGAHVQPYLIDSVLTAGGEELFRNAPQGGDQVLDPGVNATMVDIMQEVVTGGTARAARIPGWRAAGKTGTTQNSADAWFVGYTPVMSAAVWMGHKDALVPMPGVTGGSTPARVWQAFMERALEGTEPREFPDPGPDARRDVAEGLPVVVPDVVEMDETAALTALARARLIGDVVLVASRTEPGTVLWQSPSAGTDAETGDTVRIGVSSGRAPAPAPPPQRPPEPEQESEPVELTPNPPDDDEGGGEVDLEPQPDDPEPAPPEEGLPPPDPDEVDRGDGDA